MKLKPDRVTRMRWYAAPLAALVASLVAPGGLFAQPTITKSFNPTSVQIGQRSTLTFAINNPAASAISAVAFTDSFPANLFVATPNNLIGSCGAGTITAAAGSTAVSLSGGTIDASASCTFSIDVIVLHQTSFASVAYVNTTGNVTASSGSGNTATATLNAAGGTFSVAKGFAPNSIGTGGVSTLTFTITSSQPNSASPFINQVADVVFQDVLPAGLVVATPNGLSLGTCASKSPTITATAGSNTITLGNLPLNNAGGNTGGITFTNSGGAFDTCSFSVDVTASTSGSLLNTVTQSIGGDAPLVSNSGNNGSATLDVIALVPPSIAKAFNPTTISPNGASTLTLTITNPAANPVALAGVAVTDNFPAGLVVATPNNLASTCGGTATATGGSGTVSLTGGTVAANGSCTVAVDVTAATAGPLNNTTDAVSSTNGGTGNTASASLDVQAIAQVPAVSGPGLVLTVLLLAGLGFLRLRGAGS